MAKERVTIQDIADALGISRNTASKALNDSGNIPDETRNRVIKKA
ncbi:LacI family DNA-binding transcriptional regulator, partial [Paenibacillus sp.]